MITFLDLKTTMPEDKTIMFPCLLGLYHYSLYFSHDDKLSQRHMSLYVMCSVSTVQIRGDCSYC